MAQVLHVVSNGAIILCGSCRETFSVGDGETRTCPMCKNDSITFKRPTKPHYHVYFSTVGCTPDDYDIFDTLAQARYAMADAAATERMIGNQVSGNQIAKPGHAVRIDLVVISDHQDWKFVYARRQCVRQ